MQTNKLRGGLSVVPAVLRWAAPVIMAAALIGQPAPATAQDGLQATSPIDRLPPIDLFVYADQSGSAFKTVNGVNAATKLATMVKSVLDSPLQAGNPRTVLGKDGRFFLYGFGEANPAAEKAHDCSDDTMVLANKVPATNRPNIDAALQKYASNDPKNRATNFECLFSHISSNQDIVQSAAAGHQAFVLIASDFLHDPFDKANISLPADRTAITEGRMIEGQGICQLEAGYRANTFPPSLKAALDRTRQMGQGQAGRPQFALLELKLTQDNFSAPSEYATCALNTSRDSLIPNWVGQTLDAARFNFEDANNFGSAFINTLLARAQPTPVLSKAAIRSTGANQLMIDAAVTNVTDSTLMVRGLAAEVDGRRVDLPLPGSGVEIPGRQEATLPTLTLRTPREQTTPLALSVLYGNDGSPMIGTAQSWPLAADKPLVLTPSQAMESPDGQGRFTLTLENAFHLPLTVNEVRLSAGGQEQAVTWPAGVIPPGQPVEAPIQVPPRLMAAFKQGALQVAVSARPQGGDPTVQFREQQEIPAANPATEPKVQAATLWFPAGDNPAPDLRVTVQNDNPDPIRITHLSLMQEGGPTLDGTPAIKPPDNIIAPQQGRAFAVALEAPAGRNLTSQILESLSSGKPILVSAAGDGFKASGPASSFPLRVEYANPPQVVCPSESNAESWKWLPVNGDGGTLHLTLTTRNMQQILNPITGYKIEKDGGGELLSPPSWRRHAWTKPSPTMRQLDLDLPFSDPEARRFRYEATGPLRITLYDQEKQSPCTTVISLPAHMPGEPTAMTIDPKSWMLESGSSGNDLYLRFTVSNPGQTSPQRLDGINLLEGDMSDLGTPVEGRFTDSTATVGDKESSYISPGKVGRTVQVNIGRLGFNAESIQGKSIRLLSQHQPPRSGNHVFPIAPPTSTVKIVSAAWFDEAPRLRVQVQSSTPNSIRRLLIAGSNSRTVTPTASSEIMSLSLPQEPLMIRQEAPVDITVDLPLIELRRLATMMASPYLFACTPTGSATSCEAWYALPPMPAPSLALNTTPRDDGGTAYNATTTDLLFTVRNNGPYMDAVTGIEFQVRDGNSRQMPLPRPEPVLPGESKDFLVPLTDEVQSILLRSVDFQFHPITRQNAQVRPTTGRADPPRLSLEKVETHWLDWLIANYTPMRFFPDIVPPPAITGTVKVSRAAAGLGNYNMKVGLTPEKSDNFVSGKSREITLPALSEDQERRVFTQAFAIQFSPEPGDRNIHVRAALIDPANGNQIVSAKETKFASNTPTTISWAGAMIAIGSLTMIILSLKFSNYGLLTRPLIWGCLILLLSIIVNSILIFISENSNNILAKAALDTAKGPLVSGAGWLFLALPWQKFPTKIWFIFTGIQVNIQKYELMPQQIIENRFKYHAIAMGILSAFISIIIIMMQNSTMPNATICSSSYNIQILNEGKCP